MKGQWQFTQSEQQSQSILDNLLLTGPLNLFISERMPCMQLTFFCSAIKSPYFVSRCKVCFLQNGQYFFNSIRSVVFFVFGGIVVSVLAFRASHYLCLLPSYSQNRINGAAWRSLSPGFSALKKTLPVDAFFDNIKKGPSLQGSGPWFWALDWFLKPPKSGLNELHSRPLQEDPSPPHSSVSSVKEGAGNLSPGLF